MESTVPAMRAADHGATSHSWSQSLIALMIDSYQATLQIPVPWVKGSWYWGVYALFMRKLYNRRGRRYSRSHVGEDCQGVQR